MSRMGGGMICSSSGAGRLLWGSCGGATDLGGWEGPTHRGVVGIDTP